MHTLFKELIKPDNMNVFEDYLIQEVCPNMPNSESCRTAVLIWWKFIAHKVFSEKEAKFVCHALDTTCPNFK